MLPLGPGSCPLSWPVIVFLWHSWNQSLETYISIFRYSYLYLFFISIYGFLFSFLMLIIILISPLHPLLTFPVIFPSWIFTFFPLFAFSMSPPPQCHFSLSPPLVLSSLILPRFGRWWILTLPHNSDFLCRFVRIHGYDAVIDVFSKNNEQIVTFIKFKL